MSQTVTIWKGDIAHAYLKVRWGRKHGRPRGRGKKAYRVLSRIDFNPARVNEVGR